MEKYTIERQVGRGSYGKVSLVSHAGERGTRQYRVMKQVQLVPLSEPQRRAALQEVSVLASLRHPNIVSYHESFIHDGCLCIVMEYADGGDLAAFIRRRRGVLLAEEAVLDIFVQMCLAVKHMHKRRTLHRDLKSHNVFLTSSGMVKLGDFGIAKVLRFTAEMARTAIGTPYYVSPEICRDERYDFKSDMWSLGCVLYELMSLHRPFRADSMKNLLHKIKHEQPAHLPHIFTPDLRQLAYRLLDKRPRVRPGIDQVLRLPFVQRHAGKIMARIASGRPCMPRDRWERGSGAPPTPVPRAPAGARPAPTPAPALVPLHGLRPPASVHRKPAPPRPPQQARATGDGAPPQAGVRLHKPPAVPAAARAPAADHGQRPSSQPCRSAAQAAEAAAPGGGPCDGDSAHKEALPRRRELCSGPKPPGPRDAGSAAACRAVPAARHHNLRGRVCDGRGARADARRDAASAKGHAKGLDELRRLWSRRRAAAQAGSGQGAGAGADSAAEAAEMRRMRMERELGTSAALRALKGAPTASKACRAPERRQAHKKRCVVRAAVHVVVRA